MGGELWLMLKSPKECDKALAFVGDVIETDRLAWDIRRKSAKALEIGYKLHQESSAGAPFVAREIARRFPVTRVGASAEGWYPDKVWKSNKDSPVSTPNMYGPHENWAAWIKGYKADFDFDLWTARRYKQADWTRIFEVRLAALESEIVARFQELMNCAPKPL